MPLIRVARLDELPAGQLTRVEAGGTRIVLARVKDEVFACNDVCAHQGGPLSEGKLSGPPWWAQTSLHAKRSEEHTSELQSQSNLVCRLLLEKKKKKIHSTQS